MTKKKRAMATSICEYCGKEYTTYKASVVGRKQRYCSRNCFHQAMRGKNLKKRGGNNRTCPACGKLFWVYPSRLRAHCSIECSSRAPTFTVDNNGYVIYYYPNHPLANKRGAVREHRWIYWQEHGYDNKVLALIKRGTIHHLNGKRDDNRIKNLELRIHGNHPSGVGEHDMIKTLTILGYGVTHPDDGYCKDK